MGKRVSITLGACAAFAAAATLAGTASAGESTYAAMAFEKSSGALGTVWIQSSLTEAKANAIKECKQLAAKPNKCRIVAKVQDGCLAAALSRDQETPKHGFGSGPDARKAKKAAKKDVPGGDGKVYYAVCSDSGPV